MVVFDRPKFPPEKTFAMPAASIVLIRFTTNPPQYAVSPLSYHLHELLMTSGMS